MTRLRIVLIHVLLAIILTGTSCSPVLEQEVQLQGETMGTTYSVTYMHPTGRDFQAGIDSLLAALNQSVSTYIPESLISRFNQSADTTDGLELDQHFLKIFETSAEIYDMSEGAFDPTVMPLVNAWGFGPERRQDIDQSLLDSLLLLVDFASLTVRNGKLFKSKPNVQLDFSAVAKGYGVDLVGEFLDARNVTRYFIEIGGEVRTRGASPDDDPWVVGIERPEDGLDRQIEDATPLTDQSMATSGNYRNYVEIDGVRYGHEINPRTGRSAMSELLSVSVKARDCAVADGYATALMVMGLEKARDLVNRLDGVEALFIYSNASGEYEIERTAGFDPVTQ